MMATFANKNVRLEAAVKRSFPVSSARRSIVEHLERERGRIARELHAGAGQPLAGIKLNLETLESLTRDMTAEAAETFARVRGLTDAALAQIRAVSHRLHPPEWQDHPIDQALRDVIRESGIEVKCRTTVAIDRAEFDVPLFARTAIYRCAQECLSNVTRHSGADAVRFELSLRPGWAQLRVSDNGKGMPADAATRGIGLMAIREHAEAADGVVNIASGPNGTTVTVGIPTSEDGVV